MKREDLKLLEVISDTNYQFENDSLQSHYALINSKRIVRGHRTLEKYRKLFCRNFSTKNDSLNLFPICDNGQTNTDLYYINLPYERRNISLFKIKLAKSKYLLYNMLISYLGFETIICSIYDAKKNEIADIIHVGLSSGACGYHNEMKSQFCLECNNCQILSSSLLIENPDDSIYNFEDTTLILKYHVYYQSYSYTIVGNHFIGKEIPQYTKSYYDIQDKEYHIELPEYNAVFKTKK